MCWNIVLRSSYFHFFICLVFFFKQKTAYEMRISDWSSDVCSSDLRRAMRASKVLATFQIGVPFDFAVSGPCFFFGLSAHHQYDSHKADLSVIDRKSVV